MAILQKAEHHLGQEISHEEIEQGQLLELLIADDYMKPSEVSKTLSITFVSTYISNKAFL